MVQEEMVNMAYGVSLMMKKHGTLTQAKAAKRFKKFLEEIEDLVSEEEFWELTEIENNLQMMDLDEFEAWKKLAKTYYPTVSN
ncbi:hypothetical protein [Lactococcus lactis]|uniref:hypothetical protein n=1 Tax=Lactococcus lactis TaxID=1358 RepID=UPI0018C66301|nr:hypothetical protein [Lactococcus lactis]MBG1279319.1 hypothetical protein [Lactococcus lactis subsp. lactis]